MLIQLSYILVMNETNENKLSIIIDAIFTIRWQKNLLLLNINKLVCTYPATNSLSFQLDTTLLYIYIYVCVTSATNCDCIPKKMVLLFKYEYIGRIRDFDLKWSAQIKCMKNKMRRLDYRIIFLSFYFIEHDFLISQ